MIRFLFFLIFAAVLEIPFFLAFTFDPSLLMNHRLEVLGGHGIAIILLFFSEPRGEGWFSPERLWSRNLAAVTAVLSFLGLVAFGIFYLAQRFRRYEVTTSVEEEMDFAPSPHETPLPPSRDLKGDFRERILKEMDILPYAEILAGDDYELKRGAIEQLAFLKTAEAMTLLEQYRSDPSADIRFLVTTALARVKKDFEEELHAARENLRKDPHDINERVSLARVYLQYARSKLADVTTAQAFTSEALFHLQFAVLAEEAPVEDFRLLIGIYRETGDWDAVLQLLDMMGKRGKGSREEIAEIRTEAAYETGRFDNVVSALRKGRAEGHLGPKLSPVADWWGA